MLTKRGDDGVEAAGQRHGGDASPAGRLLPAIRCPLPRLLRRQPYPSRQESAAGHSVAVFEIGPRVSSWRPRAGSSAGDQGVFRSSSEAARSPEGIWDRRLRHCCDDLSKRGCSGSSRRCIGTIGAERPDLLKSSSVNGAETMGPSQVVSLLTCIDCMAHLFCEHSLLLCM
ncbi:uncharacterized protein [Lolium perenne]|uniref:uncharacterized protein isoform X1 n=1 Tax=Lolium perenne TaxID=4522 RepID=UPI0021F5044C|nr:uncharacterized protein LOC127314848 isoform X1 [Lolium perenne]